MALSETWPGSGTSTDPFIIHNYEINCTASGTAYGIYIGNSTVHFRITNCSISGVPGSAASDDYFDSGIGFYNVRNGRLEGNTLESNHYGVRLASCANVTVIHNNFIGNDVQAYDDGTNVWHGGYPSGGNYWSDWTVPDADSDGFVDERYQVRGVEPTGTLTIIFLKEVGTGDGTLIISPTGEAMLIDAGSSYNGDSTLAVMDRYGIDKLKYTLATHYHEDHIGSMDEVIDGLGGSGTAITGYCYDRGYSYDTSMFYDYVDSVGSKRRQIHKWDVLDLGGGVTLTCIALNGNGVSNLKGENEYGVVMKLNFGAFQTFFGGDIGGYDNSGHNDIESTVAADAGQVEVYQVDHHGSAYSSNTYFMNTIKPKISVFSAGEDNGNGHPTYDAYSRVKSTGSFMYYTTRGDGAPMLPGDGRVVNDNILLTTDGYTFSVTKDGGAFTDNYDCWQDFGGLNYDSWPFTEPDAWVTISLTTIPLEPQNLQGTGTDSLVSLTWLPPESDGGSAVTGYNVYRGSGPDDPVLLAGIGNVTGYSDAAVENAVEYYYSVAAVNSEGEGKMSWGVYVTPAALPSAPVSLQATSGDRKVVLDWSPPVYDGASQITYYKVYRGRSVDDIELLSVSDSSLTYVDDDVVNGMTYYYQVSAVNANGEGERSAMVQAIPMSGATIPSAPRNLQVKPENGGLLLTWETPATDGGSMLQGYNIYRGTDNGSLILVMTVGNALKWTDTDIIFGQIYVYSIRAVNGVGEGASSNEFRIYLLGPAPATEPAQDNIITEFWWVFVSVILGVALLIIVLTSSDPKDSGAGPPKEHDMPPKEPRNITGQAGKEPPTSKHNIDDLPPTSWERQP